MFPILGSNFPFLLVAPDNRKANTVKFLPFIKYWIMPENANHLSTNQFDTNILKYPVYVLLNYSKFHEIISTTVLRLYST